MNYFSIGSDKLKISRVITGTWQMGGWYFGKSDRKESLNSIQASLDAGINTFDTAPVYGFGKSEEILGEAMRGRRDKFVVLDKCGLRWNCSDGKFFFEVPDFEEKKYSVYRNLRKESIIYECEQSLLRLNTDYIDLYQIHWPDPSVPISDAAEAMEHLISQGKIRNVGVSNFSVQNTVDFRNISDNLDVVSVQEKFNLIDRKALTNKIPYCKKNKISFFAYSPLEQGLLSGKFGKNNEFSKGDYREGKFSLKPDSYNLISRTKDELSDLLQKYGCSMANLSLSWLLNVSGVSAVICGARTEKQAIENSWSSSIIIEDADMRKIENVFENYFSSGKKRKAIGKKD